MEKKLESTTVISLYSGPGSGKSTLSAELYAIMKYKHLSVEMVREVAKEWAFDNRKIGPFDQISIIGEQIKRESSLFGQVNYIITDSPVALGAFYFEHNHNQMFMSDMVEQYYKFCNKNNIKFKNFFLTRQSYYEQHGRFETRSEAKVVDAGLQLFMDTCGYKYDILNNPNTRAEDILKIMEIK